jgi:DNA-binding FrmR family transcriptional regulator
MFAADRSGPLRQDAAGVFKSAPAFEQIKYWGIVYGEEAPMAHTIRDKKKLLNRLRRIRGQVDAIERLLEQEEDCSAILQTIAACRGAVNGLMAEVIEGHIRFHIVDPDHQPTSQRARAAQELIEVVQAYLK